MKLLLSLLSLFLLQSCAGYTLLKRRLATSSVKRKQSPTPVDWAEAAAHAPERSAPCDCESDDSKWASPKRTDARCFFFDLGAADGETFKVFLGQSSKWQFNYDTGTFPHGQCAAYLVEPNPRFEQPLNDAKALNPKLTVPMVKEAVYMCDKDEETFFLDQDLSTGAWGSSLDGNHGSVAQTKKGVKVKLVNLVRVLKQMTLPQDTVVVKMDIEGAEYDIVPCLAKNPNVAKLIDTLYFEQHCPNGKVPGQWCASQGQAGNSLNVFKAAIETLKTAGVKMPSLYFSPML